MNKLLDNTEYKTWLQTLKTKIRSSQIKAALSVNAELIKLYWEIGTVISRKQKESKWGSGFIRQLSIDLKKEFPGMKGFSEYNLRMCIRFYLFYSQIDEICKQTVPEL